MSSGGKTSSFSLLSKNVDVVLAGRGLAISEKAAKEAVELSGKRHPRVLLVPTPIHRKADFDAFVARGRKLFGERFGGFVKILHGYSVAPTGRDIATIARADIIWVAGGNTEYMMHFWARYGQLHDGDTNLMQKISAAAEAGAVVGGGSAGMIAWCDAGFSDSDSYTYRDGSRPNQGWDYKIARGLGLVRAFGNPHHDQPAHNSNTSREKLFTQCYLASDNQWLPNIGLGVPDGGAMVLRGHKGEHSYKVLAENDEDPITFYHREKGKVSMATVAPSATFRSMGELSALAL